MINNSQFSHRSAANDDNDDGDNDDDVGDDDDGSGGGGGGGGGDDNDDNDIIIIIIIIIITIIIIIIQSKCLYVLELTVAFKSNLNNNAVPKKEKYLKLIKEMSRNYRCVKFVNLSLSSLGVFSHECFTFLAMMNDIGINKKQQLYIIKKMINIAIRATYYILFCRNRNKDSPDLMQF